MVIYRIVLNTEPTDWLRLTFLRFLLQSLPLYL